MRVPALTGIRGVAAVAVMLYHIPQQKIFAPYGLIYLSRAYLCVDLFFVLSGFVISIGYYERVMRPAFTGQAYGDFLFNRMARVFPLHLVVTLVFAARILFNFSGDGALHFTGIDLLANIAMVQAWGWGTLALAGNSWSVSTELAAYLLFPALALWAFARAGLGWALAAASAAALVAVAAFGHGVEGVLDVVQRDSVLPVVRCLAGFALGMLAYRASAHPVTRRLLASDFAFVVVCAGIVAAFAIPRGDLAVVALFPLVVLCCYYDGRLVRAVMGNRLSYHLGLISYSIYLWHPLFRDIAARFAAIAHRHGFVAWDAGFIVAMLAFTWAFCWASYQLVEVRGHRLVKALQARVEHRRGLPALGPTR